jgi:hypothetical protein
MTKKRSRGSKSDKQKVQVIESVGSGKSLSNEEISQLSKEANHQPFITYLIKYGTFIGLIIFSIGSFIQLYIVNR